jgi:hypothetical protein
MESISPRLVDKFNPDPSSLYTIPNMVDDHNIRGAICGVRADNKKEWCICQAWNSTGKRCCHLWAAFIYRTLGDARTYAENIGVVSHRLVKANIDTHATDQALENDTFNAEHDAVAEMAAFFGENLDQLTSCAVTSFDVEDHRRATLESNSTRPRVGSDQVDHHSPETDLGHGPAARRGQFCSQDPGEEDAHRELSPELNDHDFSAGAGSKEENWKKDVPSTQPAQGRPRQIRPMNPHRSVFSKSKPSTTTVRSTAGHARKIPIGATRTGNQCFILALFSVLFRLQSFPAVLVDNAPSPSHAEAVDLKAYSSLQEYLSFMRGSVTRSFDSLQQDLYSESQPPATSGLTPRCRRLRDGRRSRRSR